MASQVNALLFPFRNDPIQFAIERECLYLLYECCEVPETPIDIDCEHHVDQKSARGKN